ncbi:MAG: NADH-quinone oxidoreductase subunit N, partial [Chthoniobacterales bacterium]
MSYLQLLRLAAPETILVLTALVVLAVGLMKSRVAGFCTGLAAVGLFFAAAAIVALPREATLFHGMLVISPLNSLFKIMCLALAFFTILLTRAEGRSPNHGEYLALILLASVGLL